MSTQTIRQRNAISQPRRVDRIGRSHANIAEWKATPPSAPAPLPAPAPTWWDRIADASWRLHDSMPWAWAIAGAVVLLASALATAAIVATALGWQP